MKFKLTQQQRELLQVFIDTNNYTNNSGYKYSMLITDTIKSGEYTIGHKRIFNDLRDIYIRKYKQNNIQV